VTEKLFSSTDYTDAITNLRNLWIGFEILLRDEKFGIRIRASIS